MKKARIVIGANYGDEGKGTVTATITKKSSGTVLNILTNGGSQRGHSILTKDGNITFQHFGSGTYYGADNYYSRFFILNPMQFVKEYESLIVKPKNIYRDWRCLWTSPYDSLANIIMEKLNKRKASCGMGIWNTIKRSEKLATPPFSFFIEYPYQILLNIKLYYETLIDIPQEYKSIWDSPILQEHFINDCKFMYEHTKEVKLSELNYNELIFENGQGLLLCDTGKDTPDTTPSNTGITDALELLKENHIDADVTAHYVTRPYMTRHGDGHIDSRSRSSLSKDVQEDRTNHYNEFQGNFRYGKLDIENLRDRILNDSKGYNYTLEITHCDEMDRISEFKKYFNSVNTYDSPLI